MRSNTFWVLAFAVFIAIGVFIWAFAGRSTSRQNTEGQQVNPQTSTSIEDLVGRVKVAVPEAGAEVGQSFEVTGVAPGPWFFEASFPIEVRDETGAVIAVVVATAQDEWMTPEDVPFKAQVDVPGFSGDATLVLMRDNPSGLPENDASVALPVVIK